MQTPTKRTAQVAVTAPAKRQRRVEDRTNYKDSSLEIQNGIVLRQFYPPELTDEQARRYGSGELERPLETLEKALTETKTQRENIAVRGAVVHWFKCDLRTSDNFGLHLASQLAHRKNVPLICLFFISPQDWEAHLTSAVRVDFVLRTLGVLKQDLSHLDIPLYIEAVEKRKKLPQRLVELCTEWNASHVFCNAEYEVDELRREASLIQQCLEKDISFNVVHDSCVVQPGKLKTGSGGAISVYSPWHRKWCSYLNTHPADLAEFPAPSRNTYVVRERFSYLFHCPIPNAPASKALNTGERERFAMLWPPGEHEAMERLRRFVNTKISEYSKFRGVPAANTTAVISVHLAAGTLAARACVRMARDTAPDAKLTDDRKQGHSMWIAEVAWRDFYKHVLCYWPYICMNKPFKTEYSNIEWDYSQENFRKWTEGKTGFPIVDAAMRQLLNIGYMHNRCRMIVASFLAMEHLVDGDFASNNGGWGFSASCGVDPQPFFRIFNPLLQSEKFDPDGEYIRKWIPELQEVKDNAVHDPYGRGAGSVAKRNGYPEPIVDHRKSRERAIARIRAGISRNPP